MEPLTARKTFTYTLRPTAEQEGTMAGVLRRCCDRYTAALQERQERQERQDAWQNCRSAR